MSALADITCLMLRSDDRVADRLFPRLHCSRSPASLFASAARSLCFGTLLWLLHGAVFEFYLSLLCWDHTSV